MKFLAANTPLLNIIFAQIYYDSKAIHPSYVLATDYRLLITV